MKSSSARAPLAATQQPDGKALTFSTTLQGDVVLVGAEEFEVVQKFYSERRLQLRPLNVAVALRDRMMQEADYNSARPQLVRAKGRS